MKRIVSWICVLVLCLSSMTTVLANEIDQHKSEKEEINQDITVTKERLDQVKSEQNKVSSQLEAIDRDLKVKEDELANIEKKLDDTIALLKKTREELKRAEDEAHKYEELMADRLNAMYMAGNTSYMELLFEAKSLNEFLDKLEMIKFMVTYDNEVFDKMVELKEAVSQKEEELTVQEETIKETKADITKQKSLIEFKKQERLQVMSNLQEEAQGYEKDLEKLEQASKDLETTIQRLIKEQEEQRRKEEEKKKQEEKRRKEEQQKLAEQQNNKNEGKKAQTDNNGGSKDRGSGNKDQGRGSSNGGAMIWPAPGFNHISSYFGTRPHPVTGEKKSHRGIDISGGGISGQNAVAADGGTVIISQYSSSYGNYVVIDHGGGLTTTYAHGSKRLVSVGQKVSRGQAVIKIGSTGISTGPHLHFEVRKNGTAVNPLGYLR